MEHAIKKAAGPRGMVGHHDDLQWLFTGKAPSGAMDDAKFLLIYEAHPLAQVKAIKGGLAPILVEQIALSMHISKDKLLMTLGLARSTVLRKTSQQKPLTADESSRLLGISKLIGQVRAMVEQSGDAKGFDAAAWVADWLDQPLPALAGLKPAELMDTAEGQALVAQQVARMQSGAYA